MYSWRSWRTSAQATDPGLHSGSRGRRSCACRAECVIGAGYCLGMVIAEELQRLVDSAAGKSRGASVIAALQSGDGGLDLAAADTSSAMATTTPYFLASITKMYTATVVMELAESGTIDLDAPISAYVDPELIRGIHVLDDVDYTDQITGTRLLAQTSGLADYFEGAPKGGVSLVDDLKQGRDRSLGIEDIVEIVRGLRPEFPPGAEGKAHYSDTNYALLGTIIESVTGATVAANFEEKIFAPLGLTETYVFDHTRDQSTPAPFHFKDRVMDIPLAMSSFAPDGGVVSTVSDSIRFLRAFFGAELLSEPGVASMTSHWNRIFFPLQYGSGVMRFRLPRWMTPFKAAPELIGHSGSTGSFAFYHPKRDVYLAGSVNQMDNPNRPYRLMTRMIDLLD